MKTCVFILGTNAVGKSTLAREVIARFGGVAEVTPNATYCRRGHVCLAGKYRDGGRFGGVDGLRAPGGSSGTRMLADAVGDALRRADTIFCEGSYMNTFGLNMTNAMFKAQRHLVVMLYAPPQVIADRLVARSGSLKNGFAQTLNKQRQALAASRKWQTVGVRVMMFDTSQNGASAIADKVLEVLGL